MKAFITKYALTKGIVETEGQFNRSGWLHMDKKIPEFWQCGFPARCSHTTREAAIARAEEMRVKKIESLRKQITKLENLKF